MSQTIPYVTVFKEKAKSGSYRARLDEVFEKLEPDLYRKIYEFYNKGEVYIEGEYAYKIDPNPTYGDTVYQNAKPKFKKPSPNQTLVATHPPEIKPQLSDELTKINAKLDAQTGALKVIMRHLGIDPSA